MKRNITVQLDDSTIQKARVVAARRSMSISRLVSEEIERTAAKDLSWKVAQKTALSQLAQPFHLGGGKLPSRDSLYER
jgi:post-segregation antitoxin (ccd killing protein)